MPKKLILNDMRMRLLKYSSIFPINVRIQNAFVHAVVTVDLAPRERTDAACFKVTATYTFNTDHSCQEK